MAIQKSTMSHPYGWSSAGVVSFGEGAKRFSPENATLAKGTARMKGTSRSVVVVAGKVFEPGAGWRRGTIEKRVRSSVRVIASGTVKMSSRKRFGRDGRRYAQGVLV